LLRCPSPRAYPPRLAGSTGPDLRIICWPEKTPPVHAGGFFCARKRPPTEAALLFLSRPPFHDLDVSVNLTGNHEPAARQIMSGPRLRPRSAPRLADDGILRIASDNVLRCPFDIPQRIHWNLDSAELRYGVRRSAALPIRALAGIARHLKPANPGLTSGLS
jgi:hypothetical protein